MVADVRAAWSAPSETEEGNVLRTHGRHVAPVHSIFAYGECVDVLWRLKAAPTRRAVNDYKRGELS